MLAYVLQRVLILFITVLGITLAVFALIRMAPGDPILLMLGEAATPETIEILRAKLGLDQPIHVQYLLYLKRLLLEGDWGRCMLSGVPVLPLVLDRLGATILLTVVSVAVASAMGVAASTASVMKGGKIERIESILSVASFSMPVFVSGLIFILVFSVHLRLLPFVGFEGPEYLIMPAMTIAIFLYGMVSRISKSSMLDVMSQDHVAVARAKGLEEKVVFVKHILRNALIPIITFIFLQFGILLGGAIITETVFAYPGIGSLVVSAIYERNYPVIQGCILMIAILVCTVNLLVDLLYPLLDPRVRMGRRE